MPYPRADHGSIKRDATRLAFVAERERMRHYRKALACAHGDALKQHWTRELEASLGRAASLASTLIEAGDSVPVAAEHPDAPHCLMDAMNMALSNGDMVAAQSVALECMRLIDMRCERMQDHVK